MKLRYDRLHLEHAITHTGRLDMSETIKTDLDATVSFEGINDGEGQDDPGAGLLLWKRSLGSRIPVYLSLSAEERLLSTLLARKAARNVLAQQ